MRVNIINLTNNIFVYQIQISYRWAGGGPLLLLLTPQETAQLQALEPT